MNGAKIRTLVRGGSTSAAWLKFSCTRGVSIHSIPQRIYGKALT
jgi:hypothetical protein